VAPADPNNRVPVVIAGAGQLELSSTGAWATEMLASPEGTVVPLGLADLEQVASASPTTPAAVPQDHLEPVLLRHLETLGLAEIRFGAELTALDQDADGVTVMLRERAGGAERVVRGGYLVGADGAHSRVRRLLGVAMDGPDHLHEELTVLFEAPLAEVVGDRRHGIYCIQHPEASGILVPNGTHDRWLYGRAWDPSRERLEDYTDARLTDLIHTAAGAGDLPVRIVAKGAFSFAAQVAERYREGRAFLVGDAAQRMTPRGGMGMNTAVAEGHDLAWKLAWTLAGWAGPSLLDTYEAEWRPIGTRRVTCSAHEGARPSPAEALAEDLNGRLPHAWLPSANGHPRSTLDLLGPGLTLLTGPNAAAWPTAAAKIDPPFPLAVHTLDPRPPPPSPSPRTAPPWSAPTPSPSPTTPPDPPANLAGPCPGGSTYSNRRKSSAVILAWRRTEANVPRGSAPRCKGTITVRCRSSWGSLQ